MYYMMELGNQGAEVDDAEKKILAAGICQRLEGQIRAFSRNVKWNTVKAEEMAAIREGLNRVEQLLRDGKEAV